MKVTEAVGIVADDNFVECIIIAEQTLECSLKEGVHPLDGRIAKASYTQIMNNPKTHQMNLVEWEGDRVQQFKCQGHEYSSSLPRKWHKIISYAEEPNGLQIYKCGV